MALYKIIYYTSGGYKTSIEMDVPYRIERNKYDQSIKLYDGETYRGDTHKLEKLIEEKLGFIEDRCVVDVEEI